MKLKKLNRKLIERTIRDFSNMDSSSFPYSPNYHLPDFNQYYSISEEFGYRNKDYSAWWRYLEIIYSFENELIGKNLDIGSGWGTIYFILKKLGFESHALDLKNLIDVDEDFFTIADLNESKPLPFDDSSFDSVTLVEVLEHIDNPVYLIREISRILRNKGTFVLSTPNIMKINERLYFFLGGIFPKFKWLKKGRHRFAPVGGLGGHVSPIAYHQICWILERSGFEIEKISTNTFDYSESFIKRFILSSMSSFINLFKSEKNPILEWGHTLIIKVRKKST